MLTSWVKFGVTDPRATISYLFGGERSVNLLCLRRLARLLRVPSSNVNKYLEELEEMKSKIAMPNPSDDMYPGAVDFPEGLYVICRTMNPKKVIETGVCSGVSSTYILSALEKNGQGELFSLDAPNYETEYFPSLGLKPVSILPEGKEVGYAIPESLRSRWNLFMGKSSEVLPQLLKNQAPIDVFFHDSEHTYDNMLYEFQEAWPNLREDGLLLADNFLMSNALEVFAKTVESDYVPIYFGGWAGMVKNRLE